MQPRYAIEATANLDIRHFQVFDEPEQAKNSSLIKDLARFGNTPKQVFIY